MVSHVYLAGTLCTLQIFVDKYLTNGPLEV